MWGVVSGIKISVCKMEMFWSACNTTMCVHTLKGLRGKIFVMCFLTTVGKISNLLGINFLRCGNVTFI